MINYKIIRGLIIFKYNTLLAVNVFSVGPEPTPKPSPTPSPTPPPPTPTPECEDYLITIFNFECAPWPEPNSEVCLESGDGCYVHTFNWCCCACETFIFPFVVADCAWWGYNDKKSCECVARIAGEQVIQFCE